MPAMNDGPKKRKGREWLSVGCGLACFGFELEFQGAGAGVGDLGGEGGLYGVAVVGREEFFEATGVHGAGVGVGNEVGAVGIGELVDDDAVGAGGGAFVLAIVGEELEFAAGVGAGD